jgi:hypothetical protein
MPWPDIAKELGVHAARSTLEKLFHGYDLHRYKARLKPALTPKMMHDRVVLAQLGLTIDICRIVFTDEIWVEFNTRRQQRNQTRKKGENPYNCPRPKIREKGTRLMFTSAINSLVGQAPGFVYPKPTEESKKRNFEVYQEMEQERKERAEKRVALAADPASEESRQVAAFNADIDRQNQEQGRTGRHKLRHRKAEQVFKRHPLPNPAKTKGGVNWTQYREQFLLPILYPWIREVLQPKLLEETGDDTVWLVEDNAPCHQTARAVDIVARAAMRIHTFDWPAHSPDLNEIERCWDYEKDDVSTLQFTGASQETIEHAKASILLSSTSLTLIFH